MHCLRWGFKGLEVSSMAIHSEMSSSSDARPGEFEIMVVTGKMW